MRGSRGRGTRPFPGMQLGAKVSGVLSWSQAGQRGTPGQSASPGTRWQIPWHSCPLPFPKPRGCRRGARRLPL